MYFVDNCVFCKHWFDLNRFIVLYAPDTLVRPWECHLSHFVIVFAPRYNASANAISQGMAHRAKEPFMQQFEATRALPIWQYVRQLCWWYIGIGTFNVFVVAIRTAMATEKFKVKKNKNVGKSQTYFLGVKKVKS